MRLKLSSLLLLLSPILLHSQTSQLIGNWQEPSSHSIVRIEPCGNEICLRLVSLSPTAPSVTDIHNPNASLQSRPLCGLEIGQHFHPTDAYHATDGTLYDPKSGNTYKGTMHAEGDKLILRGYIGTPLFGRSEQWQRTSDAVPTCLQPGKTIP